jgi:hypothetical protein
MQQREPRRLLRVVGRSADVVALRPGDLIIGRRPTDGSSPAIGSKGTPRTSAT